MDNIQSQECWGLWVFFVVVGLVFFFTVRM